MYMIPIIWSIHSRYTETESRQVVFMGWGTGKEDTPVNTYGVSFQSDENVLGLNRVVLAQQCECPKCQWTAHFRMIDFMLCKLHLNKLKIENCTKFWLLSNWQKCWISIISRSSIDCPLLTFLLSYRTGPKGIWEAVLGLR